MARRCAGGGEIASCFVRFERQALRVASRAAAAVASGKVAPVLLGVMLAGSAWAQPCEPGFVDQEALHYLAVRGDSHALAVFDDGRGEAVYTSHSLRIPGGLGPHDPEVSAPFLRLGDRSVAPVGIGVDGLSHGFARTMRVLDLDGAGGEPPKLYAAGTGFTGRVWRYDGDQWEALPEQLPRYGFEVWDLTDFDDGAGRSLYITGNFGTHYGLRYGEGAHGLARWDEATETWAPVGDGLWREAGGAQVGRVMAVFDEDGRGPKAPALFVGGAFDHAGEMAVTGLVRWDGAELSAVGELKRDDGEPVTVTAMFVHNDGSGEALYIGGSFQEAGGVRSPGLVRWDGERFSDVGGGLPAPTSLGAYYYARTLSTWREGGRDLLMVGGNWRRSAPGFGGPLVLWDGAQWRPLMTEGVDGGPQILDALAVFEDGEQVVYIAGLFGEVEGKYIPGMARWDGERWSGYNKGLGASVDQLHVFDDGAGPRLILPPPVIIGERFWEGLAAWDGEQFVEYPIPGLEGESFRVHDVATIDGRQRMVLISSGEPTLLGTGRSGLIWEYDGSSAMLVAEVNTIRLGHIPDLHVVEFDDGSGPALHMAGNFLDIEGKRVSSHVVKREGDEWVTLGEGLEFAGNILQHPRGASVIVFDDGSGPALYIGAREMSIGGEETRGGLARWDGEQWEGSVGDYELPAPHTGQCWDLEIVDGKLHAILALERPSGEIVPGVARLDGEMWTVLGLTDAGSIFDLRVFDDGSGEKLHAVGGFREIAGVEARGGAIWDGESWSPMSGGFNGGARVMAVYDAGDGPDLYIGGSFDAVYDRQDRIIPTGRLARWAGCRDSCPADLTGDGALDFADFLAFQSLFAAGDPAADFDADGALTFFDFLAYQDAFAAGCP